MIPFALAPLRGELQRWLEIDLGKDTCPGNDILTLIDELITKLPLLMMKDKMAVSICCKGTSGNK